MVNCKVAHAEKGGLIWLDGTREDYFCVVGRGFVKMSRNTSAGQEVTTELMGPGQVFGLLGALDGHGCPQSAKAVTDVCYLKVRKTAFTPIYESNQVIKDSLVRRTGNRLRQAYDMIAYLSGGKVEQRVAAVLLLIAQSFGRDESDGTYLDVPLTRQEIAELAGTTVESAIRVMSRWQKAGWVSTKSQTICILEIDELFKLVRG